MRDQRNPSALQITAILKGLVFCFAFLIVASLIMGIVVSIADDMREDTTNRILMVVNYVAIFAGGLFTARLVYRKGWLNGGIVGLIYMVIVVFIGSQFVEVQFGLEIVLRLLSGFLAGAVGGVFGVNLK